MRGFLSQAHLISITVAVVLGISAAAPVFAQDDTRSLSGAATAWLGTPPPADCTIEAASVDAIVAPLTTPSPVDESTFLLTVPTESDLPEGEPPDDEALEAASATMWEAVACLNAGEFGKFFALLSPEGVRAFYFGIIAVFGGEPAPPTADDLAEFRESITTNLAAPPTVVPESEQAKIDAIRDARMLPDGRLLFVIDGTLGVDASMYMVFSSGDERWLIDAFGQIGVFDTGLGE